jgi:hypothetical protein
MPTIQESLPRCGKCGGRQYSSGGRVHCENYGNGNAENPQPELEFRPLDEERLLAQVDDVWREADQLLEPQKVSSELMKSLIRVRK